MNETVSIKVTGKVQGVFFRQSTRSRAVELGIAGTVSNEPDGSVSIHATGTSEQIQKLVAWCRQGPPRSHVKDVIVKPATPAEFSGFAIR